MPPFASLQAGQIARELARVQAGRHGYANRNSRYYPCVSGEPLPPTFSLSGSGSLPSYSTSAPGRPAIAFGPNGAAAGTGVITWPKVPRVSVDDLTTLALRWQVYAGAWPTSSFSSFDCYMGSHGFRKAVGVGAWQVFTPSGTTTTTVTAATGTWFDLKLVFEATATKFYINDVLVHTTDPLAITGATSTPIAAFTAGGTDSPTLYVGMHESSWSN